MTIYLRLFVAIYRIKYLYFRRYSITQCSCHVVGVDHVVCYLCDGLLHNNFPWKNKTNIMQYQVLSLAIISLLSCLLNYIHFNIASILSPFSVCVGIDYTGFHCYRFHFPCRCTRIVYSTCFTWVRSEGASSCRTSSYPSSSLSNVPGATSVSVIGLKWDVFLVISWLLVELVAVTNVPFIHVTLGRVYSCTIRVCL